MNPLETYAPSGRFAISGTLVAFAIAALAGLASGALYGALESVNPLIYLTIVGTVLFGKGLGWVDNQLLKFAHVRAPWLAAILALWTGLFGLYGAWAGWSTAFLYQVEGEGVIWDPITLFGLMTSVLEFGAWSLRDITPTGPALAGIWSLEALIVVGGTVFTGRSQAGEPYCERSGHWFATELEEQVLENISDEALIRLCGANALTDLAARPLTTTDVVLAATLKVGQGPPETGALSFDRVTLTVAKNGKRTSSRTHVLQHFLVRGPVLAAARQMPAVFQQANQIGCED